jgi:hypothetical protein
MMVLKRFVIPGRAESAGPESITPVYDYGFRARHTFARFASYGGRPGMT